jgi:type I restriction enzyme S subunit
MHDTRFVAARLGEACRLITDGSHFSPAPQVEGRPIVNAKDIPRGRVELSTCTRISEVDWALLRTQHCAPEVGDVLLSKDGTIGRVVHYREDQGVVLLSSVAILRPDNSLDPEFLAQVLRSHLFDAQLYRLQSGSALKRLVLADIRKIEVPRPSSAVQERIAEILSTVDEAIEQTEALIAKTQQIKAGLMHDLFTRGVTAVGQLRPPREEAPQLYKESPLGWIPQEWDVQRLDKLADVNRGKFTIRPRNDPRYYNGNYPFIQTGDVAMSAGRVLFSYSQTLNSLGLGVSRLFPVGTIMVTIAANIADTCILGIPMCAPDSLVGVVPNGGEVARFLELCIRRRKRWFENRAPQTAQKNINLDDLRPMLVPCPAPDEQSRIAERYETIDAQQLENEETAAKLSMFKRGLMQDLLNGKVSVAVDHQPEANEVAANV